MVERLSIQSASLFAATVATVGLVVEDTSPAPGSVQLVTIAAHSRETGQCPFMARARRAGNVDLLWGEGSTPSFPSRSRSGPA